MTKTLPVGPTPAPSASAARLVGDDLQHLIGWYHALRMLRPDNEIVSVALETYGDGNLDDVVVTYMSGRTEYAQVKAAVSAETALNTKWLTAPGRNNGPSILQRFWATWADIRERGHVADLLLLTNRSLDPTDLVLQARDSNGLLADRLRRATPKSAAGKARQRWADHLGVTEADLYDLLDVLHISTDATEASWRQHVVDVAQGLGLRYDEAALLTGQGQVRKWVERSRQELTVLVVEKAIERLGLRREEPYSIVLVQALDRSNGPETVNGLDWVDSFAGDDPRSRRGLRQPSEWNTVLLPELKAACKRARTENRRVMVRGAMRLPTWFAVGTELTDVAGASPSAMQGGEIWSARDGRDAPAPEILTLDEQVVGLGSELAITMAISTDISQDVVRYLRDHPAVGTHLTLALSPGPDRQSISSSAEAAASAAALRDTVRTIVRERGASKVHLFLAMPGALALLLGHFWDRMPPTQTYEDLIVGYEEAFLIRN